jgi:hypothetical protein
MLYEHVQCSSPWVVVKRSLTERSGPGPLITQSLMASVALKEPNEFPKLH